MKDDALLLVGGALITLIVAWTRRSSAAPATGGFVASGLYKAAQYPPRRSETIMLFQSAARAANLPIEWAADPGLHNILEKESGGWVGRPNYQFGRSAQIDQRDQWPQIWSAIRTDQWRNLLAEPYRSRDRSAHSSATGLGQLTSTNIRSGKYYPRNLDGIGDALEEAIGMLKYIADRYGSPANAWAQYAKGKEGY